MGKQKHVLNEGWTETQEHGQDIYEEVCTYVKPIKREDSIIGFNAVYTRWLDTVWTDKEFEDYNTDVEQSVYLVESGSFYINEFSTEFIAEMLEEREAQGIEEDVTVSDLQTQKCAYDLAHMTVEQAVMEYGGLDDSAEILEQELEEELIELGVIKPYEGYVSRTHRAQTQLAEARIQDLKEGK